MYNKCYFCLDQLPKLKKESTASLLRKFWRSRGTKEPAYITVVTLVATETIVGSLQFKHQVSLPSLRLNLGLLVLNSQ